MDLPVGRQKGLVGGLDTLPLCPVTLGLGLPPGEGRPS